MKTTEVPFLKGADMADAKTPESKPVKANAAAATLKSAAEASDPRVQTLLAELQTARLNDDDASAANVVDRIAELGYRAE